MSDLQHDLDNCLERLDKAFESMKDSFVKKEQKMKEFLDQYLKSISYEYNADEFLKQNNGVYDKLQNKFRKE